MATDAELTAAGFKLPVGNDYISLGDNAISDNARAAYEFAERFKLDNTASPLGAGADRTTLKNGDYAFWSGPAAIGAGMPTNTLGVLVVRHFGTGAGIQMWIPSPIAGPELWISNKFSAGWTEFARVDAGAVENVRMLRTAAPGALKSAPLALTLGYGGAQTTGTGTTVVIQHMPKTARRVQLNLANRNPRYDMADSPAVAITAAAIGLHNGSGGSASWTTLPGEGDTAYASGWVEVPEAWRGKDIAVRYTWSSTGAVQRNIGTGWTNGSKDNTPPLFAWLEVEVPSSTPVIAAFGDSLSSGVSSARPVVDSYIDQYARQIGGVPSHWSASGDKAAGWQGTVERKWFAYGEAITAPDVMVYFMGSNDLMESAITAWEMQARIRETVAAIQARITPVVFGATILPRNAEATGSTFETVRRQVNAWLPTSGLFRAVFPFSAAISTDDDTILPAYNADGIHLNSAGYAALAAAITQPLVTPQPAPEPKPYEGPWQDISALFDPVFATVSGFRVRRRGDQLDYSVDSFKANNTAGIVIPWASLPSGYRPAWNQYGPLRTNAGLACELTVNTGGGMVLSGAQAGSTYRGNFSIHVTSAPPTTHPGTPA